MDAVAQTAAKRSGALLVTAALAMALFGFGWAAFLRADTDWNESYGESSDIVRDFQFAEDRLGSSLTLELDITLPPGTVIESPTTLSELERLSERLNRIEGFGDSRSVLDLIERLNRLLHSDNPNFETAGTSAGANAEMLELLAFDDSETLGRWLGIDRARVRVSTGAVYVSQEQTTDSIAAVAAAVSDLEAKGWQIAVSGEHALGYDWMRDVQATQLRSFPIAFGIVFVMVGGFLRSWQLALAAMVPTLLPVVVVLGTMGWLGMSLDVARAMIAAVVIGIGVDDAVHVLAHYKRRRDQGDDPRQAITAALHHTGRAVVTTSVALALGFLTLMMSAWQTVASFGFFVALAIMGALVATLLVLPALIFAFAGHQTATLERTPALSHATGSTTGTGGKD